MDLLGKVIKHRNNMDVCYSIFRAFDMPNRVCLVADILNMGFVSTFYIDEKCLINIPKEVLSKDWLICLEPDKKCLRYSKWGNYESDK